jgi:hypothetical protein
MKFSEMTPEQFEDWMTNVRPILVRLHERSRALARRDAYRLIARPLRSHKEGT